MCRKSRLVDRILNNITITNNGFIHKGIPSPCFIWNGATSGSGRGGGYGRISIDGHTAAVHRVIATDYFGYIPLRKQVDHLCNQRLCCNPHHLEIVTHKENQRRRSNPNASN